MDVCLIPFKNNSISQNASPLKLFEYMACEKPVISSCLSTVKSTVGNRILYADDHHDFINHINHLYEDADLRKKLGSAARKFIIDDYDWKVLGNKLERTLVDSLQR